MSLLTRLSDLVDKARTVLTAAVTWIALASGVAGYTAVEVTAWLGADHPVAQAAAGVVVFLTGLGQVVRRVTPVPAAERGLSTKER